MARAIDLDAHVHTTYSDGGFPAWMVEAAAAHGLDAIGFADHLVVSERPYARERRRRRGYNLDLTADRRRATIGRLNGEGDVTVYDAAEVDFHPDDADLIAEYLEAADFAYTIGAVHEVGGVDVHDADAVASWSTSRREAAVDAYVDDVERLVRSGLFEVAAHPDILERNVGLRGLMAEGHYRRLARAFVDSRTVPEINAGRVDDEYGRLHPRARFLDVLLDHGVRVAVGSDAHRPRQVLDRLDPLEAALEDRGIEPVSPLDV